MSSVKGDRVYGGLKKDERTAQRREKFIQAGIEVMGTEGFHATTVRKLCAKAELTARYYYESFESTEDLLVAVFDQCMEQTSNSIMQEVTLGALTKDPVDLITSILDAFFAQMEDKRVARIMMLEVLCVSESVDRFSNKRLGTLGDLLLTLGKRLYPDWRISPEEGALLSISVLGAMRQATIHWMVSDYAMDRKTVVSTTSMVVFGVLKMIESETAAAQS